jgi:hypothetical protein
MPLSGRIVAHSETARSRGVDPSRKGETSELLAKKIACPATGQGQNQKERSGSLPCLSESTLTRLFPSGAYPARNQDVGERYATREDRSQPKGVSG